MITDLIKNGEYRSFGIITFFKDYFTMLGLIFGLVALVLIIWSSVLFVNAFVIFYDWFWFGAIVRAIPIISLFPPMWFHKRSHALEKAKYNIK